MATAAIKVCDRCGKGVNADSQRVSLSPDHEGLVVDAYDNDVAYSLDLCTRCTTSLRAWATEISRRAAAKEGASQ